MVSYAYDRIGRGYADTRRPDPRVAARLHAGLGDARRVVNVGAGTGSYEPDDRPVVAVEPSTTMLAQRRPGAAPAVRAVAERLPFPDGCFDAALAVFTLHHWTDVGAGLAELRRVAPRQVLLVFEPMGDIWLVDDYFPEVKDLPSERRAPTPDTLRGHLDVRSVTPLPVPSDCVDGFTGAFWNRPEAYLDPARRAGMSMFAQLDPAIVERGTDRLRRDLESGAWDERHGALRALEEMDIGYRVVVAGDTP